MYLLWFLGREKKKGSNIRLYTKFAKYRGRLYENQPSRMAIQKQFKFYRSVEDNVPES